MITKNNTIIVFSSDRTINREYQADFDESGKAGRLRNFIWQSSENEPWLKFVENGDKVEVWTDDPMAYYFKTLNHDGTFTIERKPDTRSS